MSTVTKANASSMRNLDRVVQCLSRRIEKLFDFVTIIVTQSWFSLVWRPIYRF